MNVPRLLPLVGVAVAGVLAVKALSGVTALPDMLEGAKAWAEGKAPARTADAGAPPASGAAAATVPGAPVLPPGLTPAGPGTPTAVAAASALQSQPAQAKIACSPSAAELAREAGLSPAELQILQSLQARRGQLDQREQDLDVQLQLIQSAQSKLDAKLQALGSMKTDIQGLLDKADTQKDAEVDRLVTVYSKMKPAAAAQRFTLLDDAVRIPIAARMKEAALSAIIALMPPADAKALTEKLAHRFESKALADAKAAIAPPASGAPPAPQAQAAATPPAASPATPAAAQPAAAPKKLAKARPRKPKPAAAVAANTAAPPKPAAAAPPASSAPASASPAAGARSG